MHPSGNSAWSAEMISSCKRLCAAMASFTTIGSPQQILENEPVNDIKIINAVIERVALVDPLISTTFLTI